MVFEKELLSQAKFMITITGKRPLLSLIDNNFRRIGLCITELKSYLGFKRHGLDPAEVLVGFKGFGKGLEGGQKGFGRKKGIWARPKTRHH